jgi:ATP-binding cassette, subfamily B, bacterial CvaB/MchF/RaxB
MNTGLEGSGLDLLRLSGRNKVPVLRQSEAAECGLCCLAMVSAVFGYKTDMVTLRRRFSISLKGTALKTLIAIADELGLNSRALKVEMDALEELALPCILHWNLNHFVVLVGRKRTLERDDITLHHSLSF